jgi:hypothetical protein
MNWTQAQVQAACRQYGPGVNAGKLVDGYGYPLDGVKLLWALSGEESSFGANCGPRLEPSYWDGENSKSGLQTELNKQYGMAAAKSYGPWQIMYVNCYLLGTPQQIDEDINLGAQAGVEFINSYIILDKKALNLQQVARVYNSGNLTVPMTMGVMRYIENVGQYYNKVPSVLETA